MSISKDYIVEGVLFGLNCNGDFVAMTKGSTADNFLDNFTKAIAMNAQGIKKEKIAKTLGKSRSSVTRFFHILRKIPMKEKVEIIEVYVKKEKLAKAKAVFFDNS